MSAAARRLRGLSRHALVWILGSFIVVPLLYAVLSGFKSTGDLTGDPFGLPSPWQVSNYTGILGSGDFWRQSATASRSPPRPR